MPTMPRPNDKARKIHKKVMPFNSQRDEKMSEKKKQKKDREIMFEIQQNISR